MTKTFSNFGLLRMKFIDFQNPGKRVKEYVVN